MTFNEFKKLYENTWNNSTAENPNTDFNDNFKSFDMRRTNKVLSDSALYVIWYLNENGYTSYLTTNNTSKTEWTITKEDTIDTFTLTSTNQNPKKCNIKEYVKLFEKSFAMKQELEKLRKMKVETENG